MAKIDTEQAIVLKDLKKLIGKSIPILDDVFKRTADKFCGVKVEGENIIELTICHYELDTLPESIGNLKSLQTLLLYYNFLKSLPESIGELKSLKTLWIEHQSLTALPESIGRLQSLQKLVINAHLKILPNSIGDLQSLRELSLSLNQLTTLPESLGKLKNLETLYLTKNKLTSLPDSFWRLKSLTELGTRDNPWDSKWKKILEYNTVPRKLELAMQQAPITIFISYSREDEERYKIQHMIFSMKYLPEIKVVYAGDSSKISESQLIVFIATKRSIIDKLCLQELASAITQNIPVLPYKTSDVDWEDLSKVDLGIDYNLSDKLGIEFDENDSGHYFKLYDHLKKYKSQIFLFDQLESRIDKQLMNLKTFSENFVNSEEFRNVYSGKIDLFKQLAEQFKDGQLTPIDYIVKIGEILRDIN